MGYLDNSGLAYLWRKVKSYVSTPTRTLTQAQYNALTAEEKQADVLYAVTDDGGSSGAGDSGCHNYSLEEQVVGRWIDGKPLYRKVVISALPDAINQWKPISDPIENGEIKMQIGTACPINEGSFHIPYNDGNLITIIKYRKEDNSISGFINRTDMLKVPVNIIVYYTKTTDQATIEIPKLLDVPALIPSYPAAPQSSAAAELELGLKTEEV